MEISRRSFLKKTSSSLAFGVAAGHRILRPLAAGAQAAMKPSEQRRQIETRSGDMLYRTLGRTKERISVIGLGGYHIGKPQLSEADSIKIIRSAIDHGITFMDNCWDYNNGNSEIRMGKALRDGNRQKVFLMTKIDGRTKQEAARQMDESLKRPEKRERSVTSDLPDIKILSFIFECSILPRKITFISTRYRCRSMSWTRTSGVLRIRFYRFCCRTRSGWKP